MDRKVCPDCGREYGLEDEVCVDCGSKLEIEEVFEPDEWMIAYHENFRENVEAIAARLEAHGVVSKVRFIDLADFELTIMSVQTWALLVHKDYAEAAVNLLRSEYGYTKEAEEEDVEAVSEQYRFLKGPVEELAADPALAPKVCEALRDSDLPESLAVKAREALIAMGQAAEDDVLQALESEIHEDHYAMQPWSFEPLIDVLGEIGTVKTISMLLKLCESEESTVRINAVHCLGLLGDIDHAMIITPMLEDEDDDVRNETNDALRQLTEENAWDEHIYTREDGRRAREAWEDELGEE